MNLPDQLDTRVQEAVKAFWRIRKSRNTDKAVRGGKQLDGFTSLLAEVVELNGLPRSSVFFGKQVELPGYYRGTKQWDLLVVWRDVLVAAIELKSHIGPSFGNNFNNRTEEAMGSAMDLWAAFKYDALAQTTPPWLGYMMLLDDVEQVHKPVRNSEPHFKVLPEFDRASYAQRYQVFCEKLLKEKHYSSASLVLSNKQSAKSGSYRCVSDALHIRTFIVSFASAIETFSKSHN